MVLTGRSTTSGGWWNESWAAKFAHPEGLDAQPRRDDPYARIVSPGCRAGARPAPNVGLRVNGGNTKGAAHTGRPFRSSGRELLEDPGGVELAAAVRAAVDQDVVARAEVHREVALDGVPLVVGADQLVEVVERPRRGDRAPAAAEVGAVGAALVVNARVGLLEQAPRALGAVLDLDQPLHPPRP